MKQHAVVSIQLNIVTCPMYPEKFIRDNRFYKFSLSLSHCLFMATVLTQHLIF